MNRKNTQKVVFLKGNAHKKQIYTQKKCENANVAPLKKGTAKTKSVVPLEKEQQKRKCRSFGKEQQKHTCRSFGKGNNKNEKGKSAIPFGKE